MTVVSEFMQAHIKKNASVAQSQEAYIFWITLLDTATVQPDGRIVFRFKSGVEITK